MNRHARSAAVSAFTILSAAPLYAHAGFVDRRLDFEGSTRALLSVYCCALAVVIPLSILFFRSRRSAGVKDFCRGLAGRWYCPLVLWLLLSMVVMPWLNLADLLLWFAALPVMAAVYVACMVYGFVFRILRKAWAHLYALFTLAVSQLVGYAAYAALCGMNFFRELFRYPADVDGQFIYPVTVGRLKDDAWLYLMCLALAALPVAVLYVWRGARRLLSGKRQGPPAAGND